MASFDAEIDEGFVLLDDPSTGTNMSYGASAQDGVLLSHIRPLGAYALSLTSGIIVGGTPNYVWTAGAEIDEKVKFGATPSPTLIYVVPLADRVLLAAALNVAWAVQMRERVTLAQFDSVVMALQLIDRIKLGGVASPNMVYGLTLIQNILLDGDLAAHYSMILQDTVQLHDSVQPQYLSVASLLDGVVLGDVLGSTVTFMANIADTVTLSDAEIVSMIFNSALTDCVLFKAVYVAPDGNFTTWAVNTRTNAVTEYRNFAFNSFAQIGLKYIGASSEGLFELNGETDVGVSIVAKFGGGFVEFNGSRLAGLGGVYVGMRGQGEYFLKLRTGDGLERVYRVKAQPQFMTTKVNTGKGYRSRYFSWELESTGSDFDFEAIEFVPMVFGRRV